MIRSLFIVLALIGCTDADDSPSIPPCEDLGAEPDDPLLCTAAGLCTFDGMQCTRTDDAARNIEICTDHEVPR